MRKSHMHKKKRRNKTLVRNHIHIQNKHNQNPGREHDREYDTSLVPKKKGGGSTIGR